MGTNVSHNKTGKRNTSRAVFTSHERELARRAWGTGAARLGRESFLPFGSCGLCLSAARDPVACGARGDLFCRECALDNLLAQRRAARRAAARAAESDREQREQRDRDDDQAHARAVRDFEMTLGGLDPADDRRRTRDAAADAKITTLGAGWNERARNTGDDDTIAATGDDENSSAARRKRKLDVGELARSAAEADRVKARRLLEDERAEAASKTALPSFWTPSMTPSSATTTFHNSETPATDSGKKQPKAPKTTPMCPSSRPDDPHPYTLHTLVSVNFMEEEAEEDGGGGNKNGDGSGGGDRKKRRICPACRKGLSNASKAVLAKPCGHVLCRSCVDRFMRPASHDDPHHAHNHAHANANASHAAELRCYVCEADLTDRPVQDLGDEGDNDNNDDDKDGDGGGDADGGGKKNKKKKKDKNRDKERIRPGLVELRSEGTGFSAAGANEVKKVGVAFQC